MFENFKEVFSFSGQIEIEGKNVIAEYDADNKSLRLGALTLTDASRILAQLTTKAYYAPTVSVPEHVLTVAGPTVDLVDLPPPEPEGHYKKAKRKVAVEVVPDPVEQEERAAIEAEVSVTSAAVTNYLTPEIKNASTLREVILLLADNGVRKEEDFLRICEEIKPHVTPLKQLNSEFGARVSRILASLDGIGG